MNILPDKSKVKATAAERLLRLKFLKCQIIELRQNEGNFLDKTFAKLYYCFMIETNPKRWKRIHVIPKYKQISKPGY